MSFQLKIHNTVSFSSYSKMLWIEIQATSPCSSHRFKNFTLADFSKENQKTKSPYLMLFLWSCVFIIKIQVAMIYFHAGIAKINAEEWKQGLALYYWFNHNVYGVPIWLDPFIRPLLNNSYTLVLMTWGVLMLEVLLFMSLFMNFRQKKTMLILGLAFHFLIAVFHGLLSFSLTMSAALMIYLLPFKNKSIFNQYIK